MNDELVGSRALQRGGNRILSALPVHEMEMLQPFMRTSMVMKGQVIQVQGQPVQQVSFVEQGTHALLLRTPAPAKTKAVGLVGREGFVGVSAFLDDSPVALHSAMALEDSTVTVLAVDVLRETFPERNTLRKLCLSYVQERMTQSLRLATCSYTLTSRVACWLLLLREWLGTSRIRMSQRELAHIILGTRRASVTVAAHELKRAGAIDLHRNTIVIEDADRLGRLACGCYQDVCRPWSPRDHAEVLPG